VQKVSVHAATIISEAFSGVNVALANGMGATGGVPSV
jgi:hypothetical protein